MRRVRERERGRWRWGVAPALVLAAGALLWWNHGGSAVLGEGPASRGTPPALASGTGGDGQGMSPPGAVTSAAGERPAEVGGPRVPYAAGAAERRRDQLQLWQGRLARAQSALDAYRESTRYPPGSQPMSRHPDQADPNAPVREELALRQAGSNEAVPGVHLRTSQERIFAEGNESVRFTVAAVDDDGRAVPLRVLRASAREIPAPNLRPTYPEVPLAFNDNGTDGDLVPADGVFSATLRPATQGFAGLLGQIRVEAFLQVQAQPGQVFFDVLYTPKNPATWHGEMREALVDGSLQLVLPVTVDTPGRYIVSGRVDDARGKPVALLSFNEELPAGEQAVRLTLFGRLVRDLQPAFPLTLRDVVGFRLRPDAFPDRELMPRWPGPVGHTRSYPLVAFSDADWSDEQRQRYLDELSKDVSDAQNRVAQLGPHP
jgi:hypothetical protein